MTTIAIPSTIIRTHDELVVQFCLHFGGLSDKTKVGIADIVRKLQLRGFGEKMLLDAMKEACVENDHFYASQTDNDDDRFGSLYWIAGTNGSIIGDGLSVNRIGAAIAQLGIVI